jgi:hypothetical protein
MLWSMALEYALALEMEQWHVSRTQGQLLSFDPLQMSKEAPLKLHLRAQSGKVVRPCTGTIARTRGDGAQRTMSSMPESQSCSYKSYKFCLCTPELSLIGCSAMRNNLVAHSALERNVHVHA